MNNLKENKKLQIKNATIGYDNNIIFKDLNVDFQCGKITAILGPSGCGKSTILRTLAGLLKPTVGQVMYYNEEIKKPHNDICMMHQKYVNFPWLTCLENVIIGGQANQNNLSSRVSAKKYKMDPKKIDNLEAYEILKKVGLEESALKYPHELSGGMNQRLSLARVLYRNPKVILMDEPLSALDPTTRKNMQNLLLDMHYKENNTIIMVTHDPDEAKKMCHSVIQL